MKRVPGPGLIRWPRKSARAEYPLHPDRSGGGGSGGGAAGAGDTFDRRDGDRRVIRDGRGSWCARVMRMATGRLGAGRACRRARGHRASTRRDAASRGIRGGWPGHAGAFALPCDRPGTFDRACSPACSSGYLRPELSTERRPEWWPGALDRSLPPGADRECRPKFAGSNAGQAWSPELLNGEARRRERSIKSDRSGASDRAQAIERYDRDTIESNDPQATRVCEKTVSTSIDGEKPRRDRLQQRQPTNPAATTSRVDARWRRLRRPSRQRRAESAPCA